VIIPQFNYTVKKYYKFGNRNFLNIEFNWGINREIGYSECPIYKYKNRRKNDSTINSWMNLS